ncbi:SdpI family protein [Ochrovirga pacifica]|uniref:SdpI family protein n=1 Tax=Ochrovirga pacifica TaxID=1042376 RepID=UPI000255A574|nr:SdpI family protein [Ochrovirga pacifica]
MLAITTGICYLIAGWILYKFPPKKINYLYGYRTKRSMRDQKNWDFAQKFSAIKMVLSGILIVLIGVISCLYETLWGLVLEISMILVLTVNMIITTEKALKALDQ